jgi:gluconate 2-dehydrogenase gamma chain
MPKATAPSYEHVMDRRRFLIAAGACFPVVSLAGCGGSDAVAEVEPFREDGVFFDAAALSMVDVVADIMIPETDTPGARAVDAAGFADGMMAGWAREDTRAEVRSALEWLEAEARASQGRSFLALESVEQFALVERLDRAAFTRDHVPAEVAAGHRALKQVIYTGYYLSETGATRELQYEHVPGGFRGCMPLKKIGRTWAA